MLLELKDVWIHYRKVAAVQGISISVEEGEIVALIGANGAGQEHDLAHHFRAQAGDLG